MAAFKIRHAIDISIQHEELGSRFARCDPALERGPTC
jgi:hypothetical protein